MNSKGILKLNLLIILTSNFGSFFGYLFQFYAGRILTPEYYGELNSVLSFFSVIGAFFAFIPHLISRYTIEYKFDPDKKKYFQEQCLKYSSLFCLLLFLVSFCFRLDIVNYLKIQSPNSVFYALAVVILGIFTSIGVGVLQGERKYLGATIVGFIHSFLKFFFIFIGSFWTIGILAKNAFLSLVLANFVTVVFTFLYMRKNKIGPSVNALMFKGKGSGLLKSKEQWEILKMIAPTALTIFIINNLSSLDVVLAKIIFNDFQAGMYSSVSVIGKIALFLPSALAPVMFSKVVDNEKNNQASLSLLKIYVLNTLIISGVFALACSFFPSQIVNLLFGPKYQAASILLPWVAWSMTSVAIFTVVVNFLLAKGRFFYLWPSLIAVGLVYLLQFMINTGEENIKWIPLGMTMIVMTAIFSIWLIQWIKSTYSLNRNQ